MKKQMFRVYFSDGNQMLLFAESMSDVLEHIVLDRSVNEMVKIENAEVFKYSRFDS